MAGHRILSRPGSHQALARYAGYLATDADEQALTRLDRLRRNRTRSEYGSRTFGKAEVSEAIDTAQAIRAACPNLIRGHHRERPSRAWSNQVRLGDDDSSFDIGP